MGVISPIYVRLAVRGEELGERLCLDSGFAFYYKFVTLFSGYMLWFGIYRYIYLKARASLMS